MQTPTIEAALRDVRSAKVRFRRDAAHALGGAGDENVERARTALRELLGDADPSVRATAVDSLGSIGEDSDGEPLRRLVDDSDDVVRAAAVRAVASVSTDDVRALVDLAAHEMPDVRVEAVLALGETGSTDAAEALVRRLQDRQASVRVAALTALAFGFPRRRTEDLRAALSDDDASVRLAAAIGLAVAADDAGRAALAERVGRKPRNDEWIEALAALVRVAGPGDRDTLARLAGRFAARDARALALAGLAKIGDAAAEAGLRKLSGHSDPRRRALAITAAGVARLESFLPEIEREIRNPGSPVFLVALRAAVEVASVPAAGVLVGAARELADAGKDVLGALANAAADLHRLLGDGAPAELADLAGRTPSDGPPAAAPEADREADG